MKLCTSLVAALLVIFSVGLSTAQAADRYWDLNSTNAGLFDPGVYADGVWDNLTTSLWSSSLAGTDPAIWDDAAAPAYTAIFQVDGASSIPGNTEPDAVVSVPGSSTSRVVTGLVVDSGWVALSGGGGTPSAGLTVGTGGLTVNNNSILSLEALTVPVVSAFSGVVAMGANTVTVKSGGMLSIPNIANLTHTAGGGGLILDGGIMRNTNATAGSSFYTANASITITAASGVGYFNVSNPANSGNIYTPAGTNGIKGEGGTLTNGGAGTLYKTGPGELRIGAAGNHTFKRLVVDGTGIQYTGTTTSTSTSGEYRLGAATHENVFGAIPLAPLADAITLMNGGMIGTSNSLYPTRPAVRHLRIAGS